MNLQAPTSKLQRITTAPIHAGRLSGVVHPESGENDWQLGDEAATARHPFDLEERTALFGANESLPKKDFRNIIGRCRKESKESKFFLRMIAASEPALAAEARTPYREARELPLIFCSIYRKTTP